MMPTLLPVLFLAVAGGFAWFSFVTARRRRELLAGFAASQGWTWTAEDDRWADRYAGTPFGVGSRRRARNVLEGSFRGRHILAFDYSYETHQSNGKGGSSTTTHRFAVCVASMPAPLRTVEITPEGPLGRFATALGMDDVELESEDFNRRFRVRSPDRKLAYDVLPARTMDALLARPELHVRLLDTDAICWENGTFDPVELLARLDVLCVLIDGIPAYVWSDRKDLLP